MDSGFNGHYKISLSISQLEALNAHNPPLITIKKALTLAQWTNTIESYDKWKRCTKKVCNLRINALKMEMRAFDEKQVGRKLIANVLYIINEVTPNL